MMFWDIPPAGWLILQRPTAEAGPWQLTQKNVTKHRDRAEKTLCTATAKKKMVHGSKKFIPGVAYSVETKVT